MEPIKDPKKRYIISFAVLMAGLFWIFFSFSVAQDFQSQLNKTLGYICLGTQYGTFAVFSIVGPKIVNKIGLRWSLMLGCAAYICVILGNIKPVAPLLIFLNVLLGMGATLLWNAEGVYLGRLCLHYTTCSNMNRQQSTSFFNGLFFCLFQLSGTFGTSTGSLILNVYHEATYMFIFMSITSCFGIFILFFLPDIPAPTFENVEVKEVSYYETISLLIHSNKMRLMCPIIYYNGMCLSFMMSEFMKFVAGRMLGVENSGYIISSFYCANALFCFFYGRLAGTKLGRIGLVYISFTMCSLFYILVLIFGEHVKYNYSVDGFIICVGLAFLYASGYAVWESQQVAILQSYFLCDADRNAAMANYKMWQSLGFATQSVIGIFLNTYDTFFIKIIILIVMEIIGFSNMLYLHYRIESFDISSAKNSLVSDQPLINE